MSESDTSARSHECQKDISTSCANNSFIFLHFSFSIQKISRCLFLLHNGWTCASSHCHRSHPREGEKLFLLHYSPNAANKRARKMFYGWQFLKEAESNHWCCSREFEDLFPCTFKLRANIWRKFVNAKRQKEDQNDIFNSIIEEFPPADRASFKKLDSFSGELFFYAPPVQYGTMKSY